MVACNFILPTKFGLHDCFQTCNIENGNTNQGSLQNETENVITTLLQSVTEVFYKVHQVLQSVTGCYYKMHQAKLLITFLITHV